MSSIETGIPTPIDNEGDIKTDFLPQTPLKYEKQDLAFLKRIETAGKDAVIDVRENVKDRVSSMASKTEGVIEQAQDSVQNMDADKAQKSILPVVGAGILAIAGGILLIKNRAEKKQPLPKNVYDKAKDAVQSLDSKIKFQSPVRLKK